MDKPKPLAIEKLERLSNIYNNMGAGTLSFEYEIFDEHFSVLLKHLPTHKTYEFTLELTTTYEEFEEIMREALNNEIRSAAWKGMAS